MKLMKRRQPNSANAVPGDQRGLVDEALTREALGRFTRSTTRSVTAFWSPSTPEHCIELRRRGLRVEREVTVTAFYEKYPVGHFRVDLLVEGPSRWSSKPRGQLSPKTDNNFRTGSEQPTLRSVSFSTLGRVHRSID